GWPSNCPGRPARSPTPPPSSPAASVSPLAGPWPSPTPSSVPSRRCRWVGSPPTPSPALTPWSFARSPHTPPTPPTSFWACVPPPHLLLGLGATAIIMAVNHRGIRQSTLLQNLTTFGLLAVFVLFSVLGLSRGRAENLTPYFTGEGGAWGGVLAVLAVLPIV